MRYSLTTLLLLVTVLAVAFGVWQYRVNLETQRQLRIEDTVNTLSSYSSFDIGDDPVSMIRLLNGLIALGQADCVESLSRFDKADATSSELVGVVVPLLFSPQAANPKYPVGDYTKQSMRFNLTGDSWNNLDVKVFDGIPFGMDCLTDLSSGMGFDQSHLVDWIKTEGVITRDPFQPTDNPFITADGVAELIINNAISDPSIKFEIKDSDRHKITIRVREQVYSMLEKIVDIDTNRYDNIESSDRIWLATQQQCSNRNLMWDTQTQGYRFSD